MKRIGVIAACPFVVDRGTPLRILGLCEGFAKAGHRVSVVAYPLGRDPGHPNIDVVRSPVLPGYTKTDAGPSPTKPLLDLILLTRAYWFLRREEVDLLVGSHIEGGFVVSILKKILRVPALFDAHGTFAGEMVAYDYLTENSFFLAFCEWIENFVISSVDATGTVSNHLRDEFRRRFPNSRLEVVPNGVNFDDYENPAQVTNEGEFPDNKLLITYAGNLQPYQGIDYLVEAAGRLKHDGIHFLIVGGPEEDRYKAQVKERGLEEKFTFTGRVPQNEIPGYLTRSDILVAPRIGSDTEFQQASKLVQYMAAGKPVVATDIPAHDTLEDGETGLLVEDESAGALADALSHLIKRSTLRRKLGKTARERARDFSWESIAGNFLSLAPPD